MGTVLGCGYSARGRADLYLLELDMAGQLTCLWSQRRGDSPSFLTRHGGTYYVGCELPDCARIAAYMTGQFGMREVAAINVPGESGLCHLLDTPWGIVGSCYDSGGFFMAAHDLSKVIWRDHRGTGSRGHCAALWNDHLLLVDLGLDCVDVISSDGKAVSRVQFPKGTQPRQWLWTSPNQAMLVCEAGDCLIPMKFKGDTLTAGNRIQLVAEGFPSSACLAPDGTMMVPVRGSDRIVMLSTGRQLSAPLRGQWPRYCAWMDGFVLVCMQRSDELQAYRRQGGRLDLLDACPLPGAACVIPFA